MENAIVESYIRRVSTRKVRSIVECLGIEGISADTVSRMAHDLDQGVREFVFAGPILTPTAGKKMTPPVRQLST